MSHHRIFFLILVTLICLACSGLVAAAETAKPNVPAATIHGPAVPLQLGGLPATKEPAGNSIAGSPGLVPESHDELKGRFPVRNISSPASGRGYPVPGQVTWRGPGPVTSAIGVTGLIQDGGTVVCIDEEGGVFGIITADGTHYIASNIPAKYKKEGLHVIFRAFTMPINPAYRMWGTPLRIITISEDPAWEGTIQTTGTVSWIDLEGGFYGIIADDGTRYDPLDLPEEYERDGLRVRFSAVEKPDVVSFHMWGTFISITQISLLDVPQAQISEIMVEYRRNGGFAGFDDHLVLYENGTTVVITRNTNSRYFLADPERDELANLFESTGFTALEQDELAMFKVSGNDFFNYLIEFRGHKLEAIEYAFPESLNPLIERLDELVLRGTE